MPCLSLKVQKIQEALDTYQGLIGTAYVPEDER